MNRRDASPDRLDGHQTVGAVSAGGCDQDDSKYSAAVKGSRRGPEGWRRQPRGTADGRAVMVWSSRLRGVANRCPPRPLPVPLALRSARVSTARTGTAQALYSDGPSSIPRVIAETRHHEHPFCGCHPGDGGGWLGQAVRASDAQQARLSTRAPPQGRGPRRTVEINPHFVDADRAEPNAPPPGAEPVAALPRNRRPTRHGGKTQKPAVRGELNPCTLTSGAALPTELQDLPDGVKGGHSLPV
jgi:hypothetical protein